MFLLSGVLAPLVHPRPVPGRAEPHAVGALAFPAALDALLDGSGRVPGRSALRRETAFLMDPASRGALAVQTHLGCLVASGDPVGDPSVGGELVAQFVALARGGGRVPVVRNARREALALYAAHGLTPRPAAPEVVLALQELCGGTLRRTEVGQRAQRAADAGAVLEVLPRPWAVTALPSLRALDPGLGERELRRVRAAMVRVSGRVVAFALYREGGPGGEVSLERARVADDVPEGTLAFLLLRLALRLRNDGFARLLVGAVASEEGEAATELVALLEALPVSLEARYTVGPRGWKGVWARLALQGLSEEPALLA